MRIKKEIIELLKKSLQRAYPELSTVDLSQIEIDLPKQESHGDFSTNIAMKLARLLKRPPLDIAANLEAELKTLLCHSSPLKSIRVERPGFINLFLKDEIYHSFIVSILGNAEALLGDNIGKAAKVQIEFVSANPTGPLSVAHGRQAAVGEALSRILKLFKFKVTKEYYLNDEGNQINLLGASILTRLRQLKNQKADLPENGYEGEYIKDIAKDILSDNKLPRDMSEAELTQRLTAYGLKYILGLIKRDLEDFGVKFDVWYSQKKLRQSGRIDKVLQFLKANGYAYEKDGALWFKSTQFGDDKDRVLVKSDGSFTYFAPDIAYHQHKFKRKFKRVINIWGPDHHGYINRLQAAAQALGAKKGQLEIIIVQLARIFRAGKLVAMSTRKAQYITLREVIDEVGSDVAKFFFLTRRTDSHLDFDLELAKRQSSENPVYYVQYAHARIMSIFSQAKEKKIRFPLIRRIDFSLLKEDQEKKLLRTLFRFPSSLSQALHILDPYPICQYLVELATEFHRFYDKHKVLVEDNSKLTSARLSLVKATGAVIAKGLDLLAIETPERM